MKRRSHIVSDINPETGQREAHDLPTVSDFDQRLRAEVGELNAAEAEWAEKAKGRGWHLNSIAEELRALRANPDCEWAG